MIFPKALATQLVAVTVTEVSCTCQLPASQHFWATTQADLATSMQVSALAGDVVPRQPGPGLPAGPHACRHPVDLLAQASPGDATQIGAAERPRSLVELGNAIT